MNKPKLDGGQAISLVGIVSAMVVAVIVNVLVARHYKRWDVTTNKRYTLTAATITTLHDLPDTVAIWVLLGSGDPLQTSVKQLLVAYGAETKKLDIHYIDPDKDTLALEDIRKKFKIDAGRTEDGRVVTDAIMVVASGSKHWFLGPGDMVQVVEGEEGKAKPREEQAITAAIRNVIGGEKSRICFTSGHGEMSIAQGGAEGLGLLRDLLEKDNYETSTVDTTAPNAHEPFKGCNVVVIAGLRSPLSAEEDARLKTYLMQGGNLFACVSPINSDAESGMASSGLTESLAPFGIALDETLVFEGDEQMAIPETRGVRFFVTAKTHAVTAGLVRGDEGSRDAPRVMLNFTRSLHHVSKDGSSNATDLLSSSDKSFGVVSIAGAAEWSGMPEKKAKDLSGPLVVAMASERPKLSPSSAHGPRVVVIGTVSVLSERNWRETIPVRGAAFLVEGSISWLASKPAILDVPPKAAVTSSIRITEESRNEVRKYVLLFMPLAAGLLGAGIAFRRRATETDS